MENPQHSRFKDAPWYPKDETYVLVGGAGGIGSWLCMLLSRAGFKPVVHDFDILEDHNLGGQLYSKKSIGKHKVDALYDVVNDFCNEELTFFSTKIDSTTATHIYAISAFDNMEARRNMFISWRDRYGQDPNAIFMDGRLNAEQMQIFCVRGGNYPLDIPSPIDTYDNDHLFLDSEVEDAPCTMKQTSHAAAMIASHMVGFFSNHITNVVENDNTRTVPFKWEYFIPMDLFDIQHL